MSSNYSINVTPDEFDVLIYGLTLVGVTNSAAAGMADLTDEEVAQFEEGDNILMAFYERLVETRTFHEQAQFEDEFWDFEPVNFSESEPPF